MPKKGQKQSDIQWPIVFELFLDDRWWTRPALRKALPDVPRQSVKAWVALWVRRGWLEQAPNPNLPVGVPYRRSTKAAYAYRITPLGRLGWEQRHELWNRAKLKKKNPAPPKKWGRKPKDEEVYSWSVEVPWWEQSDEQA